MRLWTLHPRYLDARGLVALWRETLLAQKVLRGLTRGYRAHPQLERFRAQAEPLAAVATYLQGVHEEATRRGYRFDASKIAPARVSEPVPETSGQLLHEWRHLLRKLRVRAPGLYREHWTVERPDSHPLFRIIAGPVAAWERSRR